MIRVSYYVAGLVKNLDDWHKVYQIVVPKVFCLQGLVLAHDHLLSGYFGINKTYNKALKHFFWPGLKSDVVHYCPSCHVCQIVGKPNQVIPPAPLSPIPVMGEPFNRVIVHCVRTIKSGHQFILKMLLPLLDFLLQCPCGGSLLLPLLHLDMK